MKYFLLEQKKDLQESKPISVDSNYEVVIKKLNAISREFKGIKANLYWKVISKGSWIAFLRDKNKDQVITYTYILGKSYKFPFMGKHDLQIGPAYTSPEFRGKGLFSALLSNVICFFNAENYHLIALVRPENVASLRCFEKNGFTVSGECEKNKFKIYHLIKK